MFLPVHSGTRWSGKYQALSKYRHWSASSRRRDAERGQPSRWLPVRPPSRPLPRAAANPALVRSRIKSRSNSGSAPIRWKMSFPPGVVVSMRSVSEIKSTPRSLRRLRVSMRFLSERTIWSSFQTITVLPDRINARSCSNPLHSNVEPIMTSLKYFSQPTS